MVSEGIGLMNHAERTTTFLAKLEQLLAEHEGRYALVRDGQVIVYDTSEEAILAGFEKYRTINSFLVLKIEVQHPHPATP